MLADPSFAQYTQVRQFFLKVSRVIILKNWCLFEEPENIFGKINVDELFLVKLLVVEMQTLWNMLFFRETSLRTVTNFKIVFLSPIKISIPFKHLNIKVNPDAVFFTFTKETFKWNFCFFPKCYVTIKVKTIVQVIIVNFEQISLRKN